MIFFVKVGMMYSLLALFAILPSCAGPPHLYANLNRVTALDRVTHGKAKDDLSVSLNFLQPLKGGWSVQVEPICPFDGEWGLRTALARELPLFKK